MREVECVIGAGVAIHHPVNIYGCRIGSGCAIGAFVEIGAGAVVGQGTKVQAFTFIPGNVHIGENVFIGPRVTFLNDKYPPSNGDWRKHPPTVVEDNAVIGGCSIIMPGVVVGEGAFIGANSFVTRSIGKGERWWGQPATKRT